MAEKDFRKVYHLNELPEMDSIFLNSRESKLVGKINESIDVNSSIGNYMVRKSCSRDRISFSTDNYTEVSYQSLILRFIKDPLDERSIFKKVSDRYKTLIHKKKSEKTNNPLMSLAYRLEKTKGQSEIIIKYIQSTNRMNQEIYDSMKKSFGVNPHEFLLAQFLYRVSPILNFEPNMAVNMLERTSGGLYQKLRDRFFDSNYNLNPKKERVIQILGEDNNWIKARK